MHGFWRAALYAAALGVLAHPVGQALPRRWFDPHQAPYRCRDWEKGGRVYNKLHIRRWKDRLPDMSRLMPDMVKKKLSAADPMSLVQETCVAECVHCWLIVLSVGMLFLWKSVWSWLLWLVYNLLGNVSFILIQRYNRPRLLRLAEKETKKNLVKLLFSPATPAADTTPLPPPWRRSWPPGATRAKPTTPWTFCPRALRTLSAGATISPIATPPSCTAPATAGRKSAPLPCCMKTASGALAPCMRR